MAVYDGPNLGSEEHADRLWQMATDLLRYLNKPLEGRDRRRNRFRSKVLTKVSRRDEKEKKKKWSVGSSVAVSHFLRPLYLYNRIRHFKPSLKRAVIYNEPLETAETNVEWQSEAFGGEGYERSKRPCQTCYSRFRNLHCLAKRWKRPAWVQFGSMCRVLSYQPTSPTWSRGYARRWDYTRAWRCPGTVPSKMLVSLWRLWKYCTDMPGGVKFWRYERPPRGIRRACKRQRTHFWYKTRIKW